MKGIAQVVLSRITMAAPGMSECGARECAAELGTLQDPPPCPPLLQFPSWKRGRVALHLRWHLLSSSSHSHQRSLSPLHAKPQPGRQGAVWPHRDASLVLSGPSPSPCSPANPLLLRPLICCKPRRKGRSMRSTDFAAPVMDVGGSHVNSLLSANTQ